MKKWIVALPLVALGATAANAQSLPGQLTACLAIPGVLQRLACYDRVAHTISAGPQPRMADRPLVSNAPPPVYVVPPMGAPAPPTGLGSERLPQTASVLARRPQELIAGITDVTYDPHGRFTATLDNGQIWRQLEGDTEVLPRVRNAQAHLSRGALGSYDLNIVGRNASYRVMRLQ